MSETTVRRPPVAARPAAPEPVARARWPAFAVFVLAVGVAAYTGFRLPNDWTATLDAVSATDGFHRRVLVGTLLAPLASATHDNYWLFASVSFLVLAALITVASVAVLRTRLTSQRLLVVGWFLLPTGGFFFSEVGYYDQLLYLLLFLALWLLARDRVILASAVMASSVLVHEITVLTVLPIFGLVALRRLGFARAVAALAPALVVEAIVLAMPASTAGATTRLANTLRQANFPYRADALALFDRTQAQSWQLYSVKDVLVYLVPITMLLVAAFLGTRYTDRAAAVWPTALAVLAIGAPTLLAFAGWDSARWAFLLVTNFVLVLWLGRAAHDREFNPVQAMIVGAALLIVTHLPMPYFDGYQPRDLTWPAVRTFITQFDNGDLFRIPRV